MRQHSRHNFISVDSLQRYMQSMQALTADVERKFWAMPPDKLAVVFDGWGEGDTQYVDIISSYPSIQRSGHDSMLLALSQMGKEDSQNYEEQYNIDQFVLSGFKKPCKIVAALIGYNCSTKKVFRRRVGLLLVGFFSHRHNLDMKDLFRKFVEMVEHVQHLMRKLSYQIPAARLRKRTTLGASLDNKTR